MQLHNLKPAEGAVKSTKRIGRGEGSGHGKTATRGGKGQTARTGYNAKKGFEGGQMPIQRRMPKRGFKNPFRIEHTVFNLGNLDFLIEKYELTEFSLDSLYVNGLINRTDTVKILGNGEMKSKLAFKVNAISEKAKQAIENAGGSVEIL
jgi:large subunit ribosomal protein L15